MSEDLKKEIRPVYSRLLNLLRQGQKKEAGFMSIDAGGLVDLYHQSIEELNQLTGHNFDKFKMINSSTGGVSSPGKPFRSFGSKVRVEEYNGKLSGIIGEMYGLYFYDETNPLDGSPSTIINQSQQQTQSV